MHFLDLILKKRNGHSLSKDEIDFFISNYIGGNIPDYQVAALLMAIWFVKMDERETADLTFAMRDSGEKVDLSDIKGIIADKHSTGGVADTTTLITAPIVAVCGLKMGKMSGRGLGHTGGTLDKLESIPGFTTSLEMNRFKELVANFGMSVVGQTGELVPADKLLYSLRDTTGTIDDISLIAASIMSKKLASGSDLIILDVKTGNGAFMKKRSEAKKLAEVMVSIGKQAGKKIEALVTDMNQPLGNGVGNSLEVQEAIEILQGKYGGDLTEVATTLAARLLFIAGLADNNSSAKQMAENALHSGKALAKFEQMIEAQGGNPHVCADPTLLPQARELVSITAPEKGYITDIATDQVGMTALLLGAGRVTKTDVIDPAVGLWMKKRRGEFLEHGEELAVFHVNDIKNLAQAKERFLSAFTFGPEPPKKNQLIYDTIL